MPAENIQRMVDLRDLLSGIADAPALSVSGMSSDSRRVRQGDVFVALSGMGSHGIEYVEQAIANGAIAVIWNGLAKDGVPPSCTVPAIAVPELEEHLGTIADRFFGSPSQSMDVIGVTGTNGKTTVAWLIAQCLQLMPVECGYVGTIGAGIRELGKQEGMTTPACVDLHRTLAEFRDEGAEAAALEVSSHALEQRRVDGVRFDTVIFTNLTRDHIDYHGDMRSYAEAKARLFFDFDATHRIINVDTDYGRRLADRCGGDAVVVSCSADLDTSGSPYVLVRSATTKPDGSVISVETSWGDTEFLLPLIGDFNIANALAVLATLLCRGTPLGRACDVLEAVTAPPGRMQRVEVADAHALPAVYVDYAHTPDALDVSLSAISRHCAGELWCVFGCGGDRDEGKRPMMGQAVARHSQHIVVTNDNPRFEDPGAIIEQVLRGIPEGALAIEDRGAAIAWTIANAANDDVVLIAGKGHEETQQIGAELLPFSDYGVALANLSKRAAAGAVS